MLKDGTYRGAKMVGIETIAEKMFGGMEVKEAEYNGINNSADLYKYLMKKSKEQQKDPEKQQQQQKQDGEGEGESGGGQGPQPPQNPKKGDIVRGPNGQYGKVTKTIGGRIKEIEPLTKEEAEKIVTGKTSFMAIQARKKNNPFKSIDIA